MIVVKASDSLQPYTLRRISRFLLHGSRRDTRACIDRVSCGCLPYKSLHYVHATHRVVPLCPCSEGRMAAHDELVDAPVAGVIEQLGSERDALVKTGAGTAPYRRSPHRVH